jgi:hypothetical protein
VAAPEEIEVPSLYQEKESIHFLIFYESAAQHIHFSLHVTPVAKKVTWVLPLLFLQKSCFTGVTRVVNSVTRVVDRWHTTFVFLPCASEN